MCYNDTMLRWSKLDGSPLSLSKMGKNNPNWKGDNVGVIALHNWVRFRFLKPEFCQKCNKNKPYDLANKSGEYKRNLSDWEWLCRRCHMERDGRLAKLAVSYPKRKGKIINCVICGKEKYKMLSIIKKGWNKYCSQSCAAKGEWSPQRLEKMKQGRNCK